MRAAPATRRGPPEGGQGRTSGVQATTEPQQPGQEHNARPDKEARLTRTDQNDEEEHTRIPTRGRPNSLQGLRAALLAAISATTAAQMASATDHTSEDAAQSQVTRTHAGSLEISLKQCRHWLVSACVSWTESTLTGAAEDMITMMTHIAKQLNPQRCSLQTARQWARTKIGEWQRQCQDAVSTRQTHAAGTSCAGQRPAALRLGATVDGIHCTHTHATAAAAQRQAQRNMDAAAARWMKALGRQLPATIRRSASAAARDLISEGAPLIQPDATAPHRQGGPHMTLVINRADKWARTPGLAHLSIPDVIRDGNYRELEDAALGQRRRSAAYAPLYEPPPRQAVQSQAWLDILRAHPSIAAALPPIEPGHRTILRHLGLIPSTTPGAVDPEHLIGVVSDMIGAGTVAAREGRTAREAILAHSFSTSERESIRRRWIRTPEQHLLTMLTATSRQVVFLHIQRRSNAELAALMHGSPRAGHINSAVQYIEQHARCGSSAALAAVGRSVAEASANCAWSIAWDSLAGGQPDRLTYGGLCCGIDGLWASLTTTMGNRAQHTFGIDSDRVITDALQAMCPLSDIRCMDVRQTEGMALPAVTVATLTSGCELHSRARRRCGDETSQWEALQQEVEVHAAARRALLEGRQRRDMPSIIIIENVEGLAESNPRTYAAMLNLWLDSPYRLAQARICAHAQGGAAQARPRIFIIATRVDMCASMAAARLNAT